MFATLPPHNPLVLSQTATARSRSFLTGSGSTTLNWRSSYQIKVCWPTWGGRCAPLWASDKRPWACWTSPLWCGSCPAPGWPAAAAAPSRSAPTPLSNMGNYRSTKIIQSRVADLDPAPSFTYLLTYLLPQLRLYHRGIPGLGTAFFSVLNTSFFCVLLQRATFFCRFLET